MKDKAILEAIARTLANHARWQNSEAAMLMCDLARDLHNFMTDAEINDLFNMYEQAKTFNQGRADIGLTPHRRQHAIA